MFLAFGIFVGNRKIGKSEFGRAKMPEFSKFQNLFIFRKMELIPNFWESEIRYTPNVLATIAYYLF
jgi:hypothetical protein